MFDGLQCRESVSVTHELHIVHDQDQRKLIGTISVKTDGLFEETTNPEGGGSPGW
jgi:hypothetical protein